MTEEDIYYVTADIERPGWPMQSFLGTLDEYIEWLNKLTGSTPNEQLGKTELNAMEKGVRIVYRGLFRDFYYHDSLDIKN